MIDNINLKIQDFRNNFNNLIKSSQLPIGVIYYVLKNSLSQIQQQYYATLNNLLLVSQGKQQKAKEIKQD